MANLPLWKITRELKRAAGHIVNLPADVTNFLFSRAYYDNVLAKKVVRTAGQLTFGQKIAIFLVYPSYGIQWSHYHALQYLIDKGYSPLVVSNLPIADADKVKLLSKCAMLIERPNFGYDFGGYRDGVLTLKDQLPNLTNLVLLNDSVWFPLPGSSDWIEEAESSDADFVGAATYLGVQGLTPERFREFKWRQDPSNKNFHICSYALMMSNATLRHPKFFSFWENFKLTNSKSKTVRRGEIGLSRWAISNGLCWKVTSDLSNLGGEFESRSQRELVDKLERLIILDNRRLSTLKDYGLKSDLSREDLVALLTFCVARQGASYALADYLIREKAFPFLKKSPVWMNKQTSDITLQIAQNLSGDEGKAILAEVEHLRRVKAKF